MVLTLDSHSKGLVCIKSWDHEYIIIGNNEEDSAVVNVSSMFSDLAVVDDMVQCSRYGFK